MREHQDQAAITIHPTATPTATAPPFHIRIDRELTDPQVIHLLEEHLTGMRAESPPECVFCTRSERPAPTQHHFPHRLAQGATIRVQRILR